MDSKKLEKAVLKKLESRLKLVIVGDGCVGKTSLLYAYGTKSFLDDHEPTVFENYVTSVTLNKKQVEMSLLDTAGQESYERLRLLSYSGVDIVLICFSVNDSASFLNVPNKWVPEIRHYCPEVPIILVATKKDLRANQNYLEMFQDPSTIIDSNEGRVMCTRVKADDYIECSSKTFEGVEQVFQTAANFAQKFHKKKSASCCLQ